MRAEIASNLPEFCIRSYSGGSFSNACLLGVLMDAD